MKKQEELTAFWKTENRLYNETNQLYHRLARHSGLSDCAFWLLYALRDEDGPLTQTQLSTLLCLPKQTVNSALKQMTEERAAARLTAEERSALLALEGKLLDAFRAETEHALTQSAAAQEDV